jgi:ribosome-associated heat shock protein Hsp15
LRIDKWLWAARFFKTRTLACEEIDKSRVEVNGQLAKPSRLIKPGDLVSIRLQGGWLRTVTVLELSSQRGSAQVAQKLYKDTEESLQAMQLAKEARHFSREPALSIEQGRPTKRERRNLDQAKHEWNDRWSASL